MSAAAIASPHDIGRGITSPSSSKELAFAIGKGFFGSLNYVKTKDGIILTKDDLQKLPSRYLEMLISAVSYLFSCNEASKAFDGVARTTDFHFTLENGIAEGADASVKNLSSPKSEIEHYQAMVERVARFAKRARIGPFANQTVSTPIFTNKSRGDISDILSQFLDTPKDDGKKTEPSDGRSRNLHRYVSKDLINKIWHASHQKLAHIKAAQTDYVAKSWSSASISGSVLSTANGIIKAAQLTLLETTPPAVFKIFGYAAIPLYFTAAGLQMYCARRDFQAAQKINDREGQNDANLSGLDGFFMASGALSWAAETISTAVGETAFATILGSTTWGLFGLGSAIQVGIALKNIVRSVDFRNHIEDFMENPQLSELQQVRGTLQFLRDQIGVTDKELQQIVSHVVNKNPDLSEEEIQNIVEKKVTSLAQTKIARFTRRCGNDSMHEVSQHIDTILVDLENEETRTEALDKGHRLINHVKKDNTKTLIYYSFVLIAALAFLTAFIFVNLSTFGAIPIALLLIAAVAYLIKWVAVYWQERKLPVLPKEEPEKTKRVEREPIELLQESVV